MKHLVAKIVLRLLLLSFLGAGVWLWFALSPIRHAPGVLIENDPVQTPAAAAATPFPFGRYQLTRLAGYHIQGRVLSVKRYHDAHADLVPIDIALGWGPMSDSAVLAKLDISQGSRFYFYHWKDQPPIPKPEIVRHSANTHIIPANREVASMLGELKTGSLVDLRGDLVSASQDQGRFVWRSSLTRKDSGNGACELMYVTQARLFNGNGDLAHEENELRLQEARGNLDAWYQALQARRQLLDPNDPEAIRKFNLEAQRYMAAAHPSPAAASPSPSPSPLPAKAAPSPAAVSQPR